MIDAKYLAEIKAREQDATPGPWVSIFDLKGFTVYDMSGEKGKIIAKLRNTKHGNQRSDASFIAHSRTDIPALITEVERLNAELIDYPHLERVLKGQQDQNARLRRIIEQKDQQIATLKSEADRLRDCKCVDKCKLVCMLDEYDKIVAERNTLKKALELACERNAEYAFCGGTEAMKAKHAKANYQHFIHQAQE